MLWHPDLLWHRNTPDAGDLACTCSWCGLAIAADAEHLRLWVHRLELRFHATCFAWLVTREGLLFEDWDALLARWRVPRGAA